MVRDWFAFSMAFDLTYYPIPFVLKMAARVVIVLCLLGAIKCILRLEIQNIPYVVFIAVLFLATAMLDYNQGKRYIFPVLPFLLLFAGEGTRAILQCVGSLVQKIRRSKVSSFKCGKAVSVASRIFILSYCILTVVMAARTIILQATQNNTQDYDGPYSAECIEMYRYIQENIDEDARIITAKPRSLYLNTQRETIPFENGHTIEEADYFLRNIDSSMMDYYNSSHISDEQKSRMTEIYQTDSFILYAINPA